MPVAPNIDIEKYRDYIVSLQDEGVTIKRKMP